MILLVLLFLAVFGAGVVAGLVICAIGLGLYTWSVLVNPFFSLVTRIQEERGQRVIHVGPYAIVRHPGYAGFLLFEVASGLALNSLLSTRFGWVDGRPSLWNSLALILVVAGLSTVIWCFGLHFIAAPQGWVWEKTPRYMLLSGPYKFTRNPMYVFESVLWLGWVLFYGSVAVFIALILMGAIFAFIIVPSEERGLEARFGETYLQYKHTVPRWFGLPRR